MGARPTDQDNERHLFRVGTCDGIHCAEAADAPRHDDTSDPPYARVSICCVSRIQLITSSDKINSRRDEPVHKRRDVVAGDAERMPEAGLFQSVDQIGSHRC